MSFQYTTIGHVTVDVLADGREQPGGSAFYSALQAAALGCRTRIITRGEPAQLARLLAPFAGRFEVKIQPASSTTRLATSGAGAQRHQRVLAWAGPLEDPGELDGGIVHLAPVARETGASWPLGADFRGLTPQGLVRSWDESGLMFPAEVEPDQMRLADGLDSAVLGAGELPLCRPLVDRAVGAGASVSITDEGSVNRILADGRETRVWPDRVERPLQDLGAGDVYAAAFFVELAAGASAREAAVLANGAARFRVTSADPSAVFTRTA